MAEFGDEFIIQSYRIPWLIWIQLLVTILLIILLFFGFAVFSSDPSAATAPPPRLDKPSSSNIQRRTKVGGHRARWDAGTSGGSARESDTNGEESSAKGSMSLRILQSPNHPCNYIVLAKQAVLKCLGLDSGHERSGNHQHDKNE